MVIDFGNGLACDTEGPTTDCPAGLLDGDSGLDTPEIELSVIENGVGDGGVFGGSRATARRMTIPVFHGGAWTREEIMRAFTPGVERVIATERGSMPYMVEALLFPKNMQEARMAFTVVIASPLAFPEGALQALSDTQTVTYDYTTTTFATGTAAPIYPWSGYVASIGQTFGATIGQKVGLNTGLRVNVLVKGTSITCRLYRVGANINDLTLLAETTKAYSATGPRYLTIACDEVANGSTTYFITASFDARYVEAYSDLSAGAATGIAYRYVETWVQGTGDVDTTADWAHQFELGTPAAATTSVLLTPDTDVPCPPKVTITLGSSASSLALSDGTRTCTITGAMDAGDVAVIDSEDRTVTVDGVNRIAWFDRDGDWAMIDPDTPSLTVNVASVLAVEWRPRLMGLI